MNKLGVYSIGVLFGTANCCYAQQETRAYQPSSAARQDALDPSPVNVATDPNVNMFINDWRNAKPKTMYRGLVFHDILTKLDGSDALHPVKKGAVLTVITAVSYATLDPGMTVEGRAEQGTRQIFYASTGLGKITVNSKSYEVKDGVGFTLTPDFDFKLSNTGKQLLGFYVRTEPLPANGVHKDDIVLVDRFNNDRRVGNHWVHICDGGPSGMLLCTIAPNTIPQPHSHPFEEAWIMVKGNTVLSLGKNLVRMGPGQAYKIPPTGITAHSNINFGSEPVEMIYMGPAISAGPPIPRDFARLEDRPIDPATEQDVDMFMGSWKDVFPRIEHGNLYIQDMLTALQGADDLHPTRKGAVLTNANAVSYAMLEPGSTAHKIDGELKDMQEVFMVNGGNGTITSGARQYELKKGMSFIIPSGLDFKLKATGDKYMTFYVVTEKLPAGFTPKSELKIVDNSTKTMIVNAWVNKERPLITKADGLSQYSALTEVEQSDMTMSRPYSDAPGVEEIWIATEGDVNMLIGRRLRTLSAGSAYRVPSTGLAAQSHINVSGSTAKFIYMVK